MLQQQLAQARAREQHRAVEELLYVAAVADVMAASLRFITSVEELDARLQQASPFSLCVGACRRPAVWMAAQDKMPPVPRCCFEIDSLRDRQPADSAAVLAAQSGMRIQQDRLTAFMSPAAADAVEAELQSTLGSHFAGQDESKLPSVLPVHAAPLA